MWKRARRRLGSKIIVLEVNTGRDLEGLLAMAVQRGVRALLVGNNPFINSQAQQLITLAARYEVPAMYGLRKYVETGGLISYSTSLPESARQAGTYVGRILKGEKPSQLPVVQPTKFELVINLKTAKALGLSVPQTLLVAAHQALE